jgi:hypothetical protein
VGTATRRAPFETPARRLVEPGVTCVVPTFGGDPTPENPGSNSSGGGLECGLARSLGRCNAKLLLLVNIILSTLNDFMGTVVFRGTVEFYFRVIIKEVQNTE